MDAINSCSIKDHQVSISCLKTYKPLYHVIDFSLSCSSETRWWVQYHHPPWFPSRKAAQLQGYLVEGTSEICPLCSLSFFFVSNFLFGTVMCYHNLAWSIRQLLLSSANLVEIHFLGLQTRVLHLMPAALRMLTAAAAHPVGTCFVTGTSKTVNYNKQNIMVFG